MAADIDPALPEQPLQLPEQLALEKGPEDLAGDQVAAAVNEAFGPQPSTGDETVDVRVELELLGPGVENGQDTWAKAAGL
jgi:hypothetical protein